jgi:hypothetical protein
MERIVLLIFGALAILLLVAMQGIDMAARIEWVDQHWPWLLRWAEHKGWHRVLLLGAICLLIADLYEIQKEPEVTLLAGPSADLGTKVAQIRQLQSQVDSLKTRKSLCAIASPAPAPASVPTTPSLNEEGVKLANEMAQWAHDEDIEYSRVKNTSPGSQPEIANKMQGMFSRKLMSDWSARFASRSEAYLQKARREQSEVYIPDDLISECKYVNNLLGANMCSMGLKAIALQLK